MIFYGLFHQLFKALSHEIMLLQTITVGLKRNAIGLKFEVLGIVYYIVIGLLDVHVRHLKHGGTGLSLVSNLITENELFSGFDCYVSVAGAIHNLLAGEGKVLLT